MKILTIVNLQMNLSSFVSALDARKRGVHRSHFVFQGEVLRIRSLVSATTVSGT